MERRAGSLGVGRGLDIDLFFGGGRGGLEGGFALWGGSVMWVCLRGMSGVICVADYRGALVQFAGGCGRF